VGGWVQGGSGDFGGVLQKSTGPLSRNINMYLGDLIKGGSLGAWSRKCMECPQVGRGDVFKQITSN